MAATVRRLMALNGVNGNRPPIHVAGFERGVVSVIHDDAQMRARIVREMLLSQYDVREFSSLSGFTSAQRSNALQLIVLGGLGNPDDSRAVRLLRDQGFAGPIIVLSPAASARKIVDIMKAGASDVVAEPVSSRELVRAIEDAVNEPVKIRVRASEYNDIRHKLTRLTPRETEVFEKVVTGRLNKQIAWTLGTVEKTVKVHRQRVMKKMGADSLADLVRMAVLVGIEPKRSATEKSKDLPAGSLRTMAALTPASVSAA